MRKQACRATLPNAQKHLLKYKVNGGAKSRQHALEILDFDEEAIRENGNKKSSSCALYRRQKIFVVASSSANHRAAHLRSAQ